MDKNLFEKGLAARNLSLTNPENFLPILPNFRLFKLLTHCFY